MARPFRWSSESKAARGEEEPKTRRATTSDPTVVARGRFVYAAQIRARGDLCCFGRETLVVTPSIIGSFGDEAAGMNDLLFSMLPVASVRRRPCRAFTADV